MTKPVYLPLTHALAWIVGSSLLVSGGTYSAVKNYQRKKQVTRVDSRQALHSIIQTGPQREVLKTEYLAELIGISSDRPVSAHTFNLFLAKERLLSSPLIAHAEVKLIKPSTLYIDYTVRRPIAWLEDYENVAIDKEGYPFPFRPFFSPKNLPALYFGLPPFGASPIDPERPGAQWGSPLAGKYVDLAFHLLNIVTDPAVADLFSVKRIDLSNAFAESCGTREIVLVTEDRIVLQTGGRAVEVQLPRIVRLSTKNYAQELGNYLKLRVQILEEEKKNLTLPQTVGPILRLPAKVIDFRIEKLAFVDAGAKSDK